MSTTGTSLNLPAGQFGSSAITTTGTGTFGALDDTGLTSAGPVVTDASGNLTSVAYSTTAGAVLTSTGTALAFLTTTLSSTALTFDKGSGAINLTQAAATSDVAPTGMSLTPQAPFANATGANRVPGSLIVALAAPTNGMTATESHLLIKRGAANAAALGPYDSAGSSFSALWLCPSLSPSSSNYTMASDGATGVYVNTPSGGTLHLAFAAADSVTFTATQMLRASGVAPADGFSNPSFGSDADKTAANTELNCKHIRLTSGVSLTATRKYILPLQAGAGYFIFNGTTGAQSITAIGATGTGVTIANGAGKYVICDGTNYYG